MDSYSNFRLLRLRDRPYLVNQKVSVPCLEHQFMNNRSDVQTCNHVCIFLSPMYKWNGWLTSDWKFKLLLYLEAFGLSHCIEQSLNVLLYVCLSQEYSCDHVQNIAYYYAWTHNQGGLLKTLSLTTFWTHVRIRQFRSNMPELMTRLSFSIKWKSIF